jgi:heme exporter protein B
MTALKALGAIIWKDLLIEFRTLDRVLSLFLFSLLVMVIFNFAFEPGSETRTDILAGILWVAFTFAGMLGLNRSFILEKEKNCLEGLILSPLDRSIIYSGKAAGNFIFMFLTELLILPFFTVFFNVPILRSLPGLVLVMVLATFGFSVIGTLVSAMSLGTRLRELLLPVLLFPLVVPVLIAAVKATAGLLGGGGTAAITGWVKLLIAFDLIFFIASFLTFEYLVEE